MARKPRKALPADEKGTRKAIARPVLEGGGIKNPASLGSSGIQGLTVKPGKEPEAKAPDALVVKRIVDRVRNGKKVHCVESKDGSKSFGCFTTRAEAVTRLGQVEGFAQKCLFVPIAKASLDEQTITGVVLQPEIVDAQGDIMAKDVIRKAAHKFLAAHNRTTKLGLMHKDFKPRFELFESYITPVDLVIGDSHVKAGSWILVIHVLDKKVWDQVKSGKLTGLSIGGKAKVSKIVVPKAA